MRVILLCLFSAGTLVSSFVPQRRGAIDSAPSRVALRMAEEAKGEEEPTDESFASAAKEWKQQQDEAVVKGSKKSFAVVGGGWGGWGAAKALCEADDVEVILLDALPDPTGKTPFLSKTGKPGVSVELLPSSL
jgi:NADPH-dependent 2,4-dienoyl-CoA reductase/sulfur reductase-like enzyme